MALDFLSCTCIQNLKTYVSISSKPDHLPRQNPWENFWKGEFPTPLPYTKKMRNPHPWGRKIMLKLPRLGNFFQNPAKKTWHRNYEKQYWNANMFRNIKTMKCIIGGWLLWIFKSFSIYKPTQVIHDKQVPKCTFQFFLGGVAGSEDFACATLPSTPLDFQGKV